MPGLVASNIRALASRRGLSQVQLAKAMGMSARTLADRWWGKTQWQLEDLDAAAAVLGVTPWDLCTPDDLWRARRDSNPQPADP